MQIAKSLKTLIDSELNDFRAKTDEINAMLLKLKEGFDFFVSLPLIRTV